MRWDGHLKLNHLSLCGVGFMVAFWQRRNNADPQPRPVYSVRVHSLRQRAGKTSYNAYDWDDEQAFVAIDRHYLALGKASLAMKPARLNAKIKEDSKLVHECFFMYAQALN